MPVRSGYRIEERKHADAGGVAAAVVVGKANGAPGESFDIRCDGGVQRIESPRVDHDDDEVARIRRAATFDRMQRVGEAVAVLPRIGGERRFAPHFEAKPAQGALRRRCVAQREHVRLLEQRFVRDCVRPDVRQVEAQHRPGQTYGKPARDRRTTRVHANITPQQAARRRQHQHDRDYGERCLRVHYAGEDERLARRAAEQKIEDSRVDVKAIQQIHLRIQQERGEHERRARDSDSDHDYRSRCNDAQQQNRRERHRRQGRHMGQQHRCAERN